MGRRLLLSVVIGASAGIAWAGNPPPPATQPAPLATKVDSLLKRLDSDSFVERQSAANEVDLLPTEALPLLEAAIKKAGPDLRSTLMAPVLRMRDAAGEEARYHKALDFFRAQTTAEYDRAGDKDPAWDDAAHRLTEEASKYLAATLRHRYVSGAAVTDAAAAVRKSGTTDPLLRYLAMRFDRAPSLQPLIDLWPAMEKSDYSAYRKATFAGYIVSVMADGKSPARRDKYNARKYLAAAAEYWPAILKNDKFPTALAITQLLQLLDDAHSAGVDRKEAFALIDAPLARQLGDEDLIRLNLRGSYYYGLANDQRAAGAGEISWEAANRSLEQAENLLSRCHELYPDDGHAAMTMLAVETMQSRGGEQFDKWFARAIKADPQNLDAYQKKFDFLDPSSFGTSGERLAFARQCLESGQFQTRIPLLVVEAHRQNDEPAPWASLVPRPYFAREDVWTDISAAYEGFLRHHPDAWDDRAAYAEIAYQAGQWAVAAEQYRQLSAAPDWAKRNTGLTRLIQLELPIRLAEPRPRPDMDALDEQRNREDLANMRRQYVDAYEAFGRKNVKWDEPARAMLEATCRSWSHGGDYTGGEVDTMLQMGKSALDAGCDDPLVRATYHVTLDTYVTPRGPSMKTTFDDDLKDLQASQYPEYLRAGFSMQAAYFWLTIAKRTDAKTKADALAQVDAVVPLLHAIVTEHQTRDEYIPFILDRCFWCIWGAEGDLDAYYQRVRTELERAKLDPFALKELEGYYRWHHALAALPKRDPGKPPAGPEAFTEYRKRAAEAEAFCEKLWQERPDRQQAVWVLIEIASYNGEPSKTEFWLRQAALRSPQDFIAPSLALSFSQRVSELDKLAHAAANTHAYRSHLPFFLVDYRVKLATTIEPGKPAPDLPDVDKISDEDTWQDIAGVFEGYLAKYPADSDRRSEYASLACRAAKWLVAAEQLRILRDRVRPKAFVTAERLAACKKKIASFDTPATQPAAPKLDEP